MPHSRHEPNRPTALFDKPARFVTSSPDLTQLPPDTLPEIAFIGRSNCGKSSLLNALTGTRSLARTSNRPGRTRLLNFFALDNTLMLVDLPGYGFAKVSKAERALWQKNWRDYPQKRTNLRHVFVLVDARRGLMDIDHNTMHGLDQIGQPYSVVLTKIDQCPRTLHDQILDTLTAELTHHPACWPHPIASSSKKGLGIEALRQEILYAASIIERPEQPSP